MTSLALSNVYIVAAKRTPFGAFGGKLKGFSATDMAVAATKAALASVPTLDPQCIQAAFCGNVIASSPDAAYLARHVALRSGCANGTPAVTVNRLCGSGMESVVQGAQAMALGMANVTLCAGAESMSQAPLQVNGKDARWGTALGVGLHLRDALWDGLTDAYAKTPMGVTAENLAKQYQITREECDAYSVQSQTRWAQAQQQGLFDLEMAPMDIPAKGGKTERMQVDEHPRPETTVEKIAKLPPVFIKDGGVVTAASSSGICDGAGSIVLATEEALREHDLTPLARVASFAMVGCDPTIMGIGPVQAIQLALAKIGKTLSHDVDRLEINEAFAAQVLACGKELRDLDWNKTNLHGGAIALGHPLGASGSRILAHLAHEFHQAHAAQHQLHVGAACIGGGQGIAVVLERV